VAKILVICNDKGICKVGRENCPWGIKRGIYIYSLSPSSTAKNIAVHVAQQNIEVKTVRVCSPPELALELAQLVNNIGIELGKINPTRQITDAKIYGASLQVGKDEGLEKTIQRIGGNDEDLKQTFRRGAQEIKEKISKIMSSLSEKEVEVLLLRLGIVDGQSRTIEQTAQELNISPRTVCRRQKSGLNKLRFPSNFRALQ
jgi:RNA polymerase primary sigma factor